MKLKYRKIPSFRFPVVPGDRVVGVAAILENGGLVVDTEKMQINAKSRPKMKKMYSYESLEPFESFKISYVSPF